MSIEPWDVDTPAEPDHVCTCGHRRTEHEREYVEASAGFSLSNWLAWFPGPCAVAGCICTEFKEKPGD